MRDYRYRVWNPEDCTMTYNVGLDRISEYADETLVKMQQTGLKDRNGTNIYEGDILSNGQHINWIIDYHVASFVVKHVGSITEDSWVLNRGMASNREIIGNIYDTPELLRVDNGEESA